MVCNTYAAAEAATSEHRHRCYTYAYHLRRQHKLRVLAMDMNGEDYLNSEEEIEWAPDQTVQDVHIVISDFVPREAWERIVVYQDDRVLHEEEALGYLADEDVLVELTVKSVAVIHNSQARAALARAQTYADSRRWDYWHKWQAEATRLESLHRQSLGW